MISRITDNPIVFLLLLPTILIALSFHELAHGYVAYRCGDNTAKLMGRLSLNPIRHLDLFGTLMIFIIGFGWAKPVPVNPRNFRKPKRDMALVSVAGVTVNFLFAFISTVIFFVLAHFFIKAEPAYSPLTLKDFLGIFSFSEPVVNYYQIGLFDQLGIVQQILLQFFAIFALINAALAVFNLLPIPPLDGSKLVTVILPPLLAAKYARIEHYTRYIILGIFLLSYVIPQVGNIIWVPVRFFRDFALGIFQEFAMLLL